MAIIKLTDIRKTFPNGSEETSHVLRGVNLIVERGDFIAVKGASGSGKTTLLSILGTLLRPDSGEYLLDGQNVFLEKDCSSVRNSKIGFIFQEHRLLPQLTAMENILLPLLAKDETTDYQYEEFADELMEMTGISDLANHNASTLSGGEASRVAACRAMIMRPDIILADEPTGQLDAENAKNIGKVLMDINNKTKTTIIMVTHSDEMSLIANKTYLLKNGILFEK